MDGGACVNDEPMKFQADPLSIPLVRPENVQTTAQRAAFLAGLASAVHSGTDEWNTLWRVGRRFESRLTSAQSAELMSHRDHALRQTIPP